METELTHAERRKRRATKKRAFKKRRGQQASIPDQLSAGSSPLLGALLYQSLLRAAGLLRCKAQNATMMRLCLGLGFLNLYPASSFITTL